MARRSLPRRGRYGDREIEAVGVVMSYESSQSLIADRPILEMIGARVGDETPRDIRTVLTTSLPASLVFTERAVAVLREAITARGCASYRIFHCVHFDLHDVDDHFDALGESARWEPLPAGLPTGEPLCTLTFSDSHAKLWEYGLLHLASHEVFIARWLWCERGEVRSLILCAAPSAAHYERLRKRVLEVRNKQDNPVWQLVGSSYDRTMTRAPVEAAELILSDELRARIDSEVIQFFAAEVGAMYRRLRVPYRRGVLLYGPPGNGKTSLIRFIGAAMPRVAAFLLRPSAKFDNDDLQDVIDQWSESAPAILVIEDLDWLLHRVNVSTFLNLLDGVEPRGGAGLLMVATTNNPEKLDPAINNRPGRFDAVIEMPLPDVPQRRAFFASHLPELDREMIEAMVQESQRLSFAHLQEILRLSGLLAIAAGRTDRCAEDLRAAARMVRERSTEAAAGFPPKLDLPFGLGALHKHRRQSANHG